MKKNIYFYVGQRIKELREGCGGKGINQEVLAKKIGVKPNAVSRWETATYKVKIGDLEKLANFFSVQISSFFPPKYQQKNKPGLNTLLSATADLHAEDIRVLTEFAEFRKMRRVLKEAEKNKK